MLEAMLDRLWALLGHFWVPLAVPLGRLGDFLGLLRLKANIYFWFEDVSGETPMLEHTKIASSLDISMFWGCPQREPQC